MGKLVSGVKAVAGAVGAAKAAYELAVKVEGKLLRARDKPAKVELFGLTLFERDANLERSYFGGLIRRGRSRYAKAAIARAELDQLRVDLNIQGRTK